MSSSPLHKQMPEKVETLRLMTHKKKTNKKQKGIGHFWVSPGLCIKTRLSAQPLMWKWFFILMQINSFFTWKVVHLASFWKWGFLEFGSGLFTTLKGVWKLVTYHHKICVTTITPPVHVRPPPMGNHLTKTLKSSKWNHYTWNPSKVPPVVSEPQPLFLDDGFKIFHCIYIYVSNHSRHGLVFMFIVTAYN